MRWAATRSPPPSKHFAGLRRFGAATLDLAWIAAGRFDAYWERDLSPWDMAAGMLLVREAGGFVSDLDGGDAVLTKGHVVAGNDTMHRELLRLLQGGRQGSGQSAGSAGVRRPNASTAPCISSQACHQPGKLAEPASAAASADPS